MAFGGLLGFSLSMAIGFLTEGSTWPGILLRSSVAALVTGFLLRWWAGVAARCVIDSQAARQSVPSSQKTLPASLQTPR